MKHKHNMSRARSNVQHTQHAQSAKKESGNVGARPKHITIFRGLFSPMMERSPQMCRPGFLAVRILTVCGSTVHRLSFLSNARCEHGHSPLLLISPARGIPTWSRPTCSIVPSTKTNRHKVITTEREDGTSLGPNGLTWGDCLWETSHEVGAGSPRGLFLERPVFNRSIWKEQNIQTRELRTEGRLSYYMILYYIIFYHINSKV